MHARPYWTRQWRFMLGCWLWIGWAGVRYIFGKRKIPMLSTIYVLGGGAALLVLCIAVPSLLLILIPVLLITLLLCTGVDMMRGDKSVFAPGDDEDA